MDSSRCLIFEYVDSFIPRSLDTDYSGVDSASIARVLDPKIS